MFCFFFVHSGLRFIVPRLKLYSEVLCDEFLFGESAYVFSVRCFIVK